MWSKRKWKANQYILFSQQMSNLCRSGISLLSSLELLAEQKIISASFYQNLTSALQAGHPLSAALKQQNFSELYVSFIRAAEEHGDYAFGFKQCEQYYMISTIAQERGSKRFGEEIDFLRSLFKWA
jgi:type II secretory pathway component PulF